jgi:hypothetical protein
VKHNLEKKSHKNSAGGVAQDEGPELKTPVPQIKKQKTKTETLFSNYCVRDCHFIGLFVPRHALSSS